MMKNEFCSLKFEQDIAPWCWEAPALYVRKTR